MAKCPGKGSHENHMCQLVARKELDDAKENAKNGKYFCMNCGRTAACEDNLCNPVKL